MKQQFADVGQHEAQDWMPDGQVTKETRPITTPTSAQKQFLEQRCKEGRPNQNSGPLLSGGDRDQNSGKLRQPEIVGHNYGKSRIVVQITRGSKSLKVGSSLAVQLLRLRLPMAGGESSIPHWGPKSPRALWPKNQNMKQKQYCNKFNKGFKNSIKDGMGEMEVYFSFKGLPL